MQKTYKFLSDTLMAAALAAAIFFFTVFLARQLAESSIYRQSKILSMLVQQESISLSGILEDTRNIDIVVKFTGALAAAYINFELIPVGEAATLVEVFESLPNFVDIEGFEYRRKDLIITGTADSTGDYESFLATLRERGHFASVTGNSYILDGGEINFRLDCASKTHDFSQRPTIQNS